MTDGWGPRRLAFEFAGHRYSRSRSCMALVASLMHAVHAASSLGEPAKTAKTRPSLSRRGNGVLYDDQGHTGLRCTQQRDLLSIPLDDSKVVVLEIVKRGLGAFGRSSRVPRADIPRARDREDVGTAFSRLTEGGIGGDGHVEIDRLAT